MSREILFKAKRKDWMELSKEQWWVEGWYVLCRKCHYILPIFNIYEEFHGYDDRYDEWVEIAPETLCQYIGKYDKIGSQICEHDVISISTYSYHEPESDYYGEVVYVEGYACWCIQQLEEKRPIPLCECEGSYLTEITIEGNAIDNPELLEEV